MSRRTLLRVALAVQLGGLALLLGWWLWPGGGTDTPEAAFTELLDAVREIGAAPAVGRLGPEVFDAAVATCNREVCISERYAGQQARWALATSAAGRDACADFRHPECTPSKIRAQLARVLKAAQTQGCEVESVVRESPRPGLRVRCGTISDFVRLKKGAGGWRLEASERSPGFLPEVYRGLGGR